ncbi:hypothetical protein K431DRAFT_161772 [Polychaeton citri CBS 116435]|uniref:Uncharacterized protein n=1 Tax=Polychaeton citri CBS 116435 TaxID=1314669 RepID=A0A9P4UKU1_9PEZI|nr:hypothetical protein K431DRAFT_161772 [Polychaeton citri CBS 116435]
MTNGRGKREGNDGRGGGGGNRRDEERVPMRSENPGTAYRTHLHLYRYLGTDGPGWRATGGWVSGHVKRASSSCSRNATIAAVHLVTQCNAQRNTQRPESGRPLLLPPSAKIQSQLDQTSSSSSSSSSSTAVCPAISLPVLVLLLLTGSVRPPAAVTVEPLAHHRPSLPLWDPTSLTSSDDRLFPSPAFRLPFHIRDIMAVSPALAHACHLFINRSSGRRCAASNANSVLLPAQRGHGVGRWKKGGGRRKEKENVAKVK